MRIPCFAAAVAILYSCSFVSSFVHTISKTALISKRDSCRICHKSQQKNLVTLRESVNDDNKGKGSFWLDPNTRGGAVVVPFASLLLPIGAYYALTASGVDGLKAGNYVTVAYIVLALCTWAGSYVFRVANKKMTYAQQLRDYEQAVLQKRFEELQQDEVEALLDEMDEDSNAEKVSFD